MIEPLLRVGGGGTGGAGGLDTNHPIKPSKEERRKATHDFLTLLAS